MTDLPPTPRRKRHAAARARTIVAGVSAGAFVALGGAMALANSAHASSGPPTSTTVMQPPSTAPTVDPFAQLQPDDRSADDWGAQPSTPTAPSTPGAPSFGADTTTHGS
jgi:hypothetical protein